MSQVASGGRPSPEPGDRLGSDANVSRGTFTSIAIKGIRFYQDYVSPMKTTSSCRFEPTCSNYGLEAFRLHGFFKGSLLTIGRLARCGPWHPGGWDPVPMPRRRQFRRNGPESG